MEKLGVIVDIKLDAQLDFDTLVNFDTQDKEHIKENFDIQKNLNTKKFDKDYRQRIEDFGLSVLD